MSLQKIISAALLLISASVMAHDGEHKVGPGPKNNQLDILIVIDDSAGLAAVRTQVANAILAIAPRLNSTKIDLKVGVTSTSLGGAIRDVQTNETDKLNFSFKIANMILNEKNNSKTHDLLAPAYFAVSSPLIDVENRGFLRTDADLAVVLVSSEVSEAALSPLGLYNKFLELKKQYRNKVYSLALVGQRLHKALKCSGPTRPPEAVSEFIALSGGILVDTCSEKFEAQISDAFTDFLIMSRTP